MVPRFSRRVSLLGLRPRGSCLADRSPGPGDRRVVGHLSRRRPARSAAAQIAADGMDLVLRESSAGAGGLQPVVHLHRLQRDDANADHRVVWNLGRCRGVPAGGLEDRPPSRLRMVDSPASVDGRDRGLSLGNHPGRYDHRSLQRPANSVRRPRAQRPDQRPSDQFRGRSAAAAAAGMRRPGDPRRHPRDASRSSGAGGKCCHPPRATRLDRVPDRG